MKQKTVFFFLLIALKSSAQFYNIGFNKKEINKDLRSMAKNDPDYLTEIKDSADIICVWTSRKDTKNKEFDFVYYFKQDPDLDELVCDSAVYRFNCSSCAEKHFKEILKMSHWKKVQPDIYYSKRTYGTMMRVENKKDSEVCKVITFVKRNWTKQEYQELTKNIKREK